MMKAAWAAGLGGAKEKAGNPMPPALIGLTIQKIFILLGAVSFRFGYTYKGAVS